MPKAKKAAKAAPKKSVAKKPVVKKTVRKSAAKMKPVKVETKSFWSDYGWVVGMAVAVLVVGFLAV